MNVNRPTCFGVEVTVRSFPLCLLIFLILSMQWQLHTRWFVSSHFNVLTLFDLLFSFRSRLSQSLEVCLLCPVFFYSSPHKLHSVVPGNATTPSAPVLQNVGPQTQTTATWNVDIAAGSSQYVLSFWPHLPTVDA